MIRVCALLTAVFLIVYSYGAVVTSDLRASDAAPPMRPEISMELLSEAATTLAMVISDKNQSTEIREEAIRASFALADHEQTLVIILQSLLKVAGDTEEEDEIRIVVFRSIDDFLRGNTDGMIIRGK